MRYRKPQPKHFRPSKRVVIIGASVLLVTIGGLSAWAMVKRNNSAYTATNDSNTDANSQSPQATTAPPKPQTTTITMAASGDQIAHDSLVAFARNNAGYDFTPLYQNIQPIIKNADIVFCNPETLVAGEQFGISGYPAFNAPTQFAGDMTKAGKCNVINQATNHINDKGQQAINANLANWQSLQPLAIAGANKSAADQQAISYFTVKDIKFAFLAYADFSNNANFAPYAINIYHDTMLFDQQLKQARSNADVVIVSMHWGTEDSTTVNQDQTAFAKRAADLGADILIGTGPHVLQKATHTTGSSGNSMLTWYSLGNLLSTQLQLNELTGGIATWSITKTDTGVKISDVKFHPTFMSYSWSADDRAANNLLARDNLALQLLKNADRDIQSMFPGASAAERLQFIKDTIGNEVTVSE